MDRLALSLACEEGTDNGVCQSIPVLPTAPAVIWNAREADMLRAFVLLERKARPSQGQGP